MKIQIAGHHTALDSALKAYVERRLSSFETWFGGFPDDAVDFHVVFEAESNKNPDRQVTASVRVNVPGHFFVGRKTADDGYLALDAAARAIEHEVTRWREQLLDRRRAGRSDDGEHAAAALAAGVEGRGAP